MQAGSFGTNWSDFEVVCAQHELHDLVRTMDSDLLVKEGVQFIKLKKPFPPPKAGQKFEVPQLGNNVVAVNGPLAPFADVIAPNSICQCKFVQNALREQAVNLTVDEFVKMGIVKPLDEGKNDEPSDKKKKIKSLKAKIKLHGALLSALFKGFESPYEANPSGRTNRSNGLADADYSPDTSGRQFYPSCQLVGSPPSDDAKKETFAYDTSSGILSNNNEQYSCSTKIDDPLSAVFYTNAHSFKIGSSDVHVEHMDVTVDGTVRDNEKLRNILDTLGIELRENVKLRFIFARNHNNHEKWENEDDKNTTTRTAQKKSADGNE